MNSSPRKVAIIDGSRIPFVRSFSKYSNLTNQEMLTATLKNLVDKMQLGGQHLDEVATGAVIKHTYDWNMSRESVLGSGLAPTTPAYDLQRACGTGLEAIVQVANKIALRQAEAGIGGGTDTNSDAPLEFQRSFAQKMIGLSRSKTLGDKLGQISKFRLNDLKPRVPAVVEPRTGMSMGQHCEKMAQKWEIRREDQDQLAFESHLNAAKAYENGFYSDLVFEFESLKQDAILRADTTVEKLAKLKTVFDRTDKATLTAGNSTALTDGASAVLLSAEDYAVSKGWPIKAFIRDAQASAIDFVGSNRGKDGHGLLMAPTIAVGQLLKRNGLTLQDFDFFEIHEAFAAQVLCSLKAWESAEFCKEHIGLDTPLGSIDRSKLNIKGGSLALGHPFAATGGRIVATLAKIIDENKGGRGLISVCTAGGMGVAAILEK